MVCLSLTLLDITISHGETKIGPQLSALVTRIDIVVVQKKMTTRWNLTPFSHCAPNSPLHADRRGKEQYHVRGSNSTNDTSLLLLVGQSSKGTSSKARMINNL